VPGCCFLRVGLCRWSSLRYHLSHTIGIKWTPGRECLQFPPSVSNAAFPSPCLHVFRLLFKLCPMQPERLANDKRKKTGLLEASGRNSLGALLGHKGTKKSTFGNCDVDPRHGPKNLSTIPDTIGTVLRLLLLNYVLGLSLRLCCKPDVAPLRYVNPCGRSVPNVTVKA